MLFRFILVVGIAIVAVHVVHSLTLDRIIEYKEVSFSSPNVTTEINGYRIAFVTDTHELSEEGLRGIARELNEKNVDLLIFGGDFSSYGETPRGAIEILSHITTTDGIYGVAGNHDNAADLFKVMEEYGITPLSNSGSHVRDKLYLAGVKDFWTHDASISEAINGALPNDFVLLVSHNADITMVQDTTSVDLVLSGHTHGGQITFFGFFAPALLTKIVTDYGHRFMSGWSTSRDGSPVYVSNGAGDYKSAPRVFARPQVILITLYTE